MTDPIDTAQEREKLALIGIDQFEGTFCSCVGHRALGLPTRARGTYKPIRSGRAAVKSGPEPDAPVSGISATGGRYAALAEYAAGRGIPMIRAQQEWHRHRVGAKQ